MEDKLSFCGLVLTLVIHVFSLFHWLDVIVFLLRLILFIYLGSNYLHKSEPDQDVLEPASEFFDYGFSVWAFPNHCMVRGCVFQASLIGLESLL